MHATGYAASVNFSKTIIDLGGEQIPVKFLVGILMELHATCLCFFPRRLGGEVWQFGEEASSAPRPS